MRRMRHLKPREVQDCDISLSSSVGLFDDTSGGSPVVAGGAVARWEDQSGNARHVTQAGAANRPSWQTSVFAGQPCVRFGINHLLTGGSFLNGKTVTACAVARRESNLNVNAAVSCGRAGGDTRPFDISMRNTFAPPNDRFTANPSPTRYLNGQTASDTLAASPMPAPVSMVARMGNTVSVSASTDIVVGALRDSGGGTGNFQMRGDIFEIHIFARDIGDYVARRIGASMQRRNRITST